MELIPIHTPLIHAGDDVAAILGAHAAIRDGDILVVSSKVIATAEGAAVELGSLTISDEATAWGAKTNRSPAMMQAVLDETIRLNGQVVGSCPGALLCELRPDGLGAGTILAPNAGLDESNIEKGWAVGWPHDPVMSAKRLQSGLNQNCAIIIGDSCCRPRRLGVTAFALAACGIDPFISEVGHTDLFGKTMRVTIEATADQLATAANMLMGNAAQSTPAVIIRGHGLPFSEYCGWVEGIGRDDDLFSGILR
jgi:coenzyme F420-0:L-glutamate ligase / coenzyme F420-1:gamma-L-glutamate ligase